jgi:membrane protein
MANQRFSRLIKILTGADPNAPEELLQLEGRLERFIHFWTLVTRHFVRNRCLIRASALSYSTLLALIPLLAVAIGVTSSLLKNQNEEKFYDAIDKFVSSVTPPPAKIFNAQTNLIFSATPTNFTETNLLSAPATNLVSSVFPAVAPTNSTDAPEQTETRVNAQKEIAHQIRAFVQNTQSKTLGVTGMIVLVCIAISMLSRIEDTFNDIWGIARGRNWLWRIVLYWTTITLGPVLLVTALGLTGSSHFQNAKNYFHQMPFIGNLIFGILPLVLLWLTFALIYRIVPNTKVNSSSAFIGGAVAGTLWQLNNIFGFLFVSRVFTNSTIYGGLGLVPVFMVGIYFSWVILLFGAQVAYAFQNRIAYLQDKLSDNVNQRGREFVALRIMTCLGQRFQNALRPPTVNAISAELNLPGRLTQKILETLVATRLVTEVAGVETAFVPARPLETINAHDILLAMRTGNGQELPIQSTTALAEIYGEFTRIEAAERHAAAAISLQTLIQRTPLRVALPEAKTIALEKSRAIETLPETVPEKDAAKSFVAEKFETREKIEVAKTELPENSIAPALENFQPPVSDLKSETSLELGTLKKNIAENPSRRASVLPAEETDFPL